jgi:hypothetical protein
VNLRESGGIETAVSILAKKMGKQKESLFADLEQKAKHIAMIKKSQYDDDIESV